MTNFEFYKDKILELAKNNKCFTIKNDAIVSCDDIFCYDCAFDDPDYICENKKTKWLYEEYTPPKPKLTKREHAFCEAVESGWLARDEDEELYLHQNKPEKRTITWVGDITSSEINLRFYPSFDFITWEDDEPYSIEEMLKWEVEE